MADYKVRDSDAINVRDYGAKGDGVTDDRAAIVLAYASASNLKKMLYFPAGDYLVKQLGATGYALRFGNSVVDLIGDGINSRILGDGGNYRLVLVSLGSVERVRIRGLRFDGVQAGEFSAENINLGVNIQQASKECLVQDCTFEYFNEDGLLIGNDATHIAADVVVQNNVFRYTGRTGVALISVNRFSVVGNIFDNPGYQGIDVEPDVNTYAAVNGVIANNVINGGGNSSYALSRAAIGLVGKSGAAEDLTGKVAITGNVISDFGNTTSQPARGIYVSDMHAVVVANNCIDHTRDAGVYLLNDTNIQVGGNSITRVRSTYGVELSVTTYSSVSENLIANGAGTGILINNTSSPFNTISRNSIFANGGMGIYVGSDGCELAGNAIFGNQLNGVWLAASNCNLLNCRVDSNGANADNTYDNIKVNGDYNNIQSNQVRKGSLANLPKYGIDIASGTGNLVTNNDCHLAGKTGDINDAGVGTVTAAGNRT